ncbi:MAG: nucleotidyltransferase domain-containing protein [bacterium]
MVVKASYNGHTRSTRGCTKKGIMIKDDHSFRRKKILEKFASQLREKLSDNLIFIKMFGSKARGDFTQDSDIDILIVVNRKTIAVRDEIYNILFELDPYYEYKISLILFSLYEYKKNEEMKSPFTQHIDHEGINL